MTGEGTHRRDIEKVYRKAKTNPRICRGSGNHYGDTGTLERRAKSALLNNAEDQ